MAMIAVASTLMIIGRQELALWIALTEAGADVEQTCHYYH